MIMYDEDQVHAVAGPDGARLIYMPAKHRLRSPLAAAFSYAWGYQGKLRLCQASPRVGGEGLAAPSQLF